jgi:hypothetical protein
VLVGTIKNDFTLERFSVNCVDSDRMVFPTRIIKIIPLSQVEPPLKRKLLRSR